MSGALTGRQKMKVPCAEPTYIPAQLQKPMQKARGSHTFVAHVDQSSKGNSTRPACTSSLQCMRLNARTGSIRGGAKHTHSALHVPV
jgi:hypothetical protein